MTGELLGIIQLTVLVALAATLVMLPPGVALAWWLARSRSPLTSIVETLVTLPLVLPPVATGYLLLRLLGRRGLLGGVVDRIGIDVIFTWRALVIAMVVMSADGSSRARSTLENVVATSLRSERRVSIRGLSPGRPPPSESGTTAAARTGSKNGDAGSLGSASCHAVTAGTISISSRAKQPAA